MQVTKDPIGTKGARLTMEVSIPGRYLVYVPDGDGVGVSRKLPDKERERLRKLASGLKLEQGGTDHPHRRPRRAQERHGARGAVPVQAATRCSRAGSTESRAPTMVFQEADLPIRVVRDVYSREFDRAVIDDEKQHHRMTSFFTRTAPELLERVELYKGDDLLFEKSGVDEVFRETLSRRVDLPHGGYLMIDHAEALTVIDVNTGSYTGRGRGSLEDTITKTNLQAAEEVVRQLRLRDIGGIIVIDFIDMAYTRNRDKVLGVLKKALDGDRTRTHVVEISPLGLVEMTRQNVSEGVREIMNKTCPTCDGEGVVRSEETIAIDVERRLRKLAKRSRAEAYLVQVHPRVAAILIGGGGKPLRELEEETGKLFHFQGTDGIPLDTFEILAEGTSRGDRGARAAVQAGRGGPDPDRGAPHVQRRRRDREDRRLRDLHLRRRPVRRREQADQDRRGAAHGGVREHRDQQRGARAPVPTTQPTRDSRTATRPRAAEQRPRRTRRTRSEAARRTASASYNRTAPRADAAVAAEAAGGVLRAGGGDEQLGIELEWPTRSSKWAASSTASRKVTRSSSTAWARTRARRSSPAGAALRRRQDRRDGRRGPRQGQGRGGRGRAREGAEDRGSTRTAQEALQAPDGPPVASVARSRSRRSTGRPRPRRRRAKQEPAETEAKAKAEGKED